MGQGVATADGIGGINAFCRRAALPCAPGIRSPASRVKVGYEISFTRHFHKPSPLWSLQASRADILALNGVRGFAGGDTVRPEWMSI
ncbi:MAG: hypothetical protein F4Y02_10905 [Chloroflexi bacterium]|nr:hypothetical protein [Chloroflexota bacterium]